MFNDLDYYPTPRAVGQRMLKKVSKEAQRFLEPQAGNGDLAAVLRGDAPAETEDDTYERRRYGPRYHEDSKNYVDCIEIDPERAMVLIGKGFPVIGDDWLEYSGVSYYDAIVMNPPFSNGDKHVLKAWEFLHGGEIVSLLNAETIRNPFTSARRSVVNLIEKHGNVEILVNCFRDAKRQTDVDVALVYLKKPYADDSADLWATPEKEREYDTKSLEETMLAVRDDLGNYEHRYNMANTHMIEAFKHIRRAAVYMASNHEKSAPGKDGTYHSDRHSSVFGLAKQNINAATAEFLREHRRDAWYTILSNMNFHKWLDKAQTDKMMREIERAQNVPLTAANIQATLDNIFSNRHRLFEESVARVFDELCKYADENSNYKEGWKTNDEYKINEKLIFPYGCYWRPFRYNGRDEGSFELYSRQREVDIYNDLDRIVARLDGRTIDKIETIGAALGQAFHDPALRKTPSTIGSTYFEIRYFKKGTVHLKWRRRDLWQKFNETAAKGRLWIGRDTRSEPRAKAAL